MSKIVRVRNSPYLYYSVVGRKPPLYISDSPYKIVTNFNTMLELGILSPSDFTLHNFKGGQNVVGITTFESTDLPMYIVRAYPWTLGKYHTWLYGSKPEEAEKINPLTLLAFGSKSTITYREICHLEANLDDSNLIEGPGLLLRNSSGASLNFKRC